MKKLLLAVILFVSTQAAYSDELYSKEANPEEYCLALNIYHEARGSNFADQVAVADVVLNRVDDSRYPNTVCNVVYDGRHKPSWKTGLPVPIRHQCQFSWYCDGKPDDPLDTDAWRKAQQSAYMIMNYGDFRGITEGSTHYHATYVKPSWARGFQLIGRIGDHIYYRWND
jgi:N-acetylmuramoyl-L-alanine amidase